MKTNERRVTPDNDVIDLREVYFALKKKILLILAAGLIGSCLYGAYTAFFMEPLYTSTSSVLVLSKETTLTSIADLQLGTQLAADYQVLIKSTSVMEDVADLQLGTQLAADYQVLIKSTSVMEDVIEDLDLKMSADKLRESISITNPTDTRILEVSVINTDGALAKKIADKVVEVASEYIGDKMEVIPPKVIEKGKIPTVQTSPSMSKNVMMGFLLGIALCGGIICALTIMDDSIKSEDDMEKYLGIAVLASVPDRKDYINQKKRR